MELTPTMSVAMAVAVAVAVVVVATRWPPSRRATARSCSSVSAPTTPWWRHRRTPPVSSSRPTTLPSPTARAPPPASSSSTATSASCKPRTAPTDAWRASSARRSSSPRDAWTRSSTSGRRRCARSCAACSSAPAAPSPSGSTWRTPCSGTSSAWLLGDKWSGNAAGDEFRRTLDEAFAVTRAVANVGEWVPWLGWLDLQGFVRRMKLLHREYDRFYEQILEDHEERRRHSGAGDGEFAAREDEDLVDVLLRLAKEDSPESEARLTRDGVKAFIQDILAAGTESSAVTMEWAMTELLRRPDAMAAATDELDRVVGRGRLPTERDLPDLPHVDAVVKETMRLHPVGPLLVPHQAREDAVVAGYDVPAGTRVLVNVWAIARDPASWPDAPGEFRPERFLGGGAADVRGAHFELLPFGAGRRMCPAYGLAMKVVAAGVASLVHAFAWRLPNGVAPADVSMEEHVGLSTRRKVPLVAVAEPRLPVHLYTAAAD